jgi:hypothetical protein
VAKLKSVTIGHRVVPAGRKRKCYHDKKHQIVKGEFCLEVREHIGWKGYCIECGVAMVNEGAAKLDALRTLLNSHRQIKS